MAIDQYICGNCQAGDVYATNHRLMKNMQGRTKEMRSFGVPVTVWRDHANPKCMLKIAAVVFLFCVPLSSLAGSFKATPVKIYFDQDTKTATLKLTNEDAEKITVQLEAKAWRQDSKGIDQYSDTTDLVFFPKIADLEPGRERLIRVGYTGQAIGNREGTYRLFVQELPISKPGEMAAKFAIRMGIPVFVQSKEQLTSPVIAGAEVKNSSVQLTMGNTGNSHYVVDKISAKGMDAKGETVFTQEIGGWYVLAGMQRIFPVNIPPADCVKAGTVEIEVKVDRQILTKTIDASPGLCQVESKSSPPMDKMKTK
jgi:fimbrial chaperone protein